MPNEINDFPLETQQELTHVKVSVKKEGLLLVQECDGEFDMILLRPEQVEEIFQLCRGRILGALTAEQLQFVSELDQCKGFLRDHGELMKRFSQSQEDTREFLEQCEPQDQFDLATFVRSLCIVARCFLMEYTQVQ